MKRIRSFNTRWEMDFRSRLWRLGLRYRIHYGPHKIDIAFPRQRLAVFLDSCFWHFCPLHGELPQTNRDIWSRKLRRNRQRDIRTLKILQDDGWTVLRFWSHDFVRNGDEVASKIRRSLTKRLTRSRE